MAWGGMYVVCVLTLLLATGSSLLTTIGPSTGLPWMRTLKQGLQGEKVRNVCVLTLCRLPGQERTQP